MLNFEFKLVESRMFSLERYVSEISSLTLVLLLLKLYGFQQQIQKELLEIN